MRENARRAGSFRLRFALALLVPSLLELGLPPSALAQKFAWPDGTIADGGWAPGAPNSHLEIDEGCLGPDDDTTVVTASAGDTTLQVSLGDIYNPPSANVIIRFRVQASLANGGPREDLEMQLFQGGSPIATTGAQEVFPRGSWMTFEYTLTGAEVSSITDYTDLRFHFIPTDVTSSDTLLLTWAELVVLEPFTTGTHIRSIGVNSGILHNAGTANATLGDPVIDLPGASLPIPSAVGAVGPGDRLILDPGTASEEVLYIKTRDSSTRVTVQTAPVASHSGPYEIRRAYCRLQSWEDYRDGNLVADIRYEVGVAYKDATFTSGIHFDGSTTDATHSFHLTVLEGQRHNGTAGTGVVLDGQNNWFIPVDNSANHISINDPNIRIEWFELIRHTSPSASFAAAVTVGDAAARLSHLLIHQFKSPVGAQGVRLSGSAGSPDSFTLRNSIIYDGERGIMGDEASMSATVENCTIYGMDREGIHQDSKGTPFTVTNTISMGNALEDYRIVTPGVWTWSYIISEDAPPACFPATCPCTSCLFNATAQDTDPGGPGDWVVFQNLTGGSEDLHLRASAWNDAIDTAIDLSPSFWDDIDNKLRPAGAEWDIGADEEGATTAVELVSFTSTGLDAEVALEWQTGSELDNLGFHLYRALSDEGPFERITSSVIPGLGSSPEGAKYSYRDSGLTNGVTYYYKLEDIETTGKTELHGPVSATPDAEASSASGDTEDSSSGQDSSTSLARITYGDPSANSLRVVRRGRRQVVLELLTEGFYAEPQEDGSVRVEIPGFEALSDADSPGIPLKRTWVEAVAGRKVKLVSVTARGVEAFTSLRPSDAEVAEIVATPEGTVRAARRRARKAFRGEGLYPSSAARIVSVGFQGDVKKALVELAPLRWDGARGQLVLARRLVVRLSFRGRELDERSTDGAGGRRYRRRPSHDKRGVVARLATTERGLHALRYEEVFRAGRGVRASKLRLSRQGETVAFHLEPKANRFKRGSVLYFVSEGASANPFGSEAVYELEVGHSGEAGEAMVSVSAAPSGEPQPFYWHRAEWEEDRYYQAALVEAPDVWLWDLLFAPEVKSYPIEVSSLAPGSDTSKLSVWLQGVSDFRAAPDHHVRVYVNGSLVEELSWDGKQARKLEVDLVPGLLRDGDNVLELENVGDTEAAYSMVMLDRYAVEYPRIAVTADGRLQGRWSESGTAELSGLAPGAHILDTSQAQPSWLTDTERGADGLLRFRAEYGRSYLAVSPEAVYHPAVTKPRASRLKNTRNRADYLVIGPEAFLQAAIPLVELRKSDGLKVKTVAIEEIYSEFGFGEPTPEAVKDFLSYAYHNWRQPSPRYVLLLGDATFDFKDHLQTGVTNQVPPRMVKTSYLWTASDPSYAAVNGDDLLPDLAIGRLPAATVEQVQAMVEKIVAYEAGEAGLHRSAVVLVADNPDGAGNFEADADELAANVLASKNPEKIYLSQLGPAATRDAILQSFDEGASLVSYVGHGGIHLWANENFFNGSDVASLGPQSQQPLVLTMNCLNGYFHFPYFNSLAEELLKAEGKGAIAAFSPSGLSLNEPAQRFHRALLQELFHGNHERLGDAMLAAQTVYTASGAFPELLAIYHLMGDPALTLR